MTTAFVVIALALPIDDSALAQTISLAAGATRYGSESLSFGASASVSGRHVITNAIALTADVAAEASQLRSRQNLSASFLGVHVLPALEVRMRRVTAFVGGRVATGYSSQAARSQSLPTFSPSTTSTSHVRTAIGPTFGAQIDVLSGPTTVRMGAREDRLHVSGNATMDRSLSASIARDRVTLSGDIGRRYASDERIGFHGGALSIALRRDILVHAGAGRFASNRLTGTPADRYLMVGMSFRLAAQSPPPAMPSHELRDAPRLAPGFTRLALDARDATRVEVAGDFNQWQFAPAVRAAAGVWYADFRIPPGQYRYAFRVNGKEWRVPRGATVTDDGFGGKSAWLSVVEPRSQSRNSQGGR